MAASGETSGEKGSWKEDRDAGQEEGRDDEIGSKPQSKKRRGPRNSSPANSRQQNEGAPLTSTPKAELQEALRASQERASQLERLLAEKEREVSKLQVARTTQDLQPSTEPMADRELKQLYCNSVQALKDYIAQTNLLSHDITGKHLPEHIILDLKTLIHRISKACLQAIKPETPMILELISKDYNMTTVASWELDKSRWINVIADLQLTEQQVLMVMKSREQHIAAMLSLFQERAVLCRQAADLAVKAATTNKYSGAGGPGSSAPGAAEDGSMLWVLMKYGYMYCAHNMVALHRILELLKETLLKEQRAIMELFLKVVYQILSPVQAAIFVVNSFPYHCDVLALANVLSSMFGKDGTGAGGPSSSAGVPAGQATGSNMQFGQTQNRPSMEQGMGIQLGGRTGVKPGGSLPTGGLQTGGMGMGAGMPNGLTGMGVGQGQSHMGSSAAGNGVGQGGDADMMASWLQMQGGGNHMEAAEAPATSVSAPNRPGAAGEGTAPSLEGLSRLKKFLNSAGMNAANPHTSPSLPGGEQGMQGGLQVGSQMQGHLGGLTNRLDGNAAGVPGSMFGSDPSGLGQLGGGGSGGMGNQAWNNMSLQQGGDMAGAGMVGAGPGPNSHMGTLGPGGQMQQWQQLQLQQQQQQLQQQMHQQQQMQMQQAKMGLSFGNGAGGLGGGLPGLPVGNIPGMLGGGGMGGGGMGYGMMGGMGNMGYGGMGGGMGFNPMMMGGGMGGGMGDGDMSGGMGYGMGGDDGYGRAANNRMGYGTGGAQRFRPY